MSDPIPPFAHLLYREQCSMHFRDSEGSHLGGGELVLTESHLVFLLAADPPFAPRQEVVFSAPLHSIRARATKPLVGRPKLEILHDADLVHFSVLHPQEWLAAIEGASPL